MSNKLKGFTSHPNNIQKDCIGNLKHKSLVRQYIRFMLSKFHIIKHAGSKPHRVLKQFV